jgi:hypothetical protein
MSDRCQVIDLAHERLVRQVDQALTAAEATLGELPSSPTFGGAHVEGDRVVVHAVARMTPAAAEALARSLYMLADEARRAGR